MIFPQFNEGLKSDVYNCETLTSLEYDRFGVI